jgi:hypothetical protein
MYVLYVCVGTVSHGLRLTDPLVVVLDLWRRRNMVAEYGGGIPTGLHACAFTDLRQAPGIPPAFKIALLICLIFSAPAVIGKNKNMIRPLARIFYGGFLYHSSAQHI